MQLLNAADTVSANPRWAPTGGIPVIAAPLTGIRFDSKTDSKTDG